MKVLITGANGFVGRHLSPVVDGEGYEVIAVSRALSPSVTEGSRAIGDMASYDDWDKLFEGVDVIVHLAARVHQMGRDEPLAYDRDNRQVVQRMAAAAIKADVKRFIFISSIKVNGESTTGSPFTVFDQAMPLDPYAQSKFAAEQQLLKMAAISNLEVVIIRPPLVYGAGVKANFQRLWQLAGWRLPLPFASLHNRRDMVSVLNLCDLIVCCLEHPAAKNRVFLVSDGSPYSLSLLLSRMRKTQGRLPWLFPFPVAVLRGLLFVLGQKVLADRLLGDLEVDISQTTALLGWQPKYTLEDSLRTM